MGLGHLFKALSRSSRCFNTTSMGFQTDSADVSFNSNVTFIDAFNKSNDCETLSSPYEECLTELCTSLVTIQF